MKDQSLKYQAILIHDSLEYVFDLLHIEEITRGKLRNAFLQKMKQRMREILQEEVTKLKLEYGKIICVRCGYPMEGLRCPNCGFIIDRQEEDEEIFNNNNQKEEENGEKKRNPD